MDTRTYDVIGDVVKKPKQLTDESMHSGGDSKEKFNLNQCPAYGPVTQPAPEVEGADETGEYAVVASISHM